MNCGDSSPPKVAEESGICGDSENKDLPTRFECPICLKCLRVPILTCCGHKFCEKCIFDWLEKKSVCPVDHTPLKPDNEHLFRDNCTSREISQQRANCLYQQFGCTVQLSLIDMEKHVDECPLRGKAQAICCNYKNLGCPEKFQSEEGLQRHLKANMNAHLDMVGAEVSRLSTQSQVKAKVLESKHWDPSPKKGADSSKESNQPAPDWQPLIKNLYEKIVILEQQNRELSIVVSNQQTALTTLETRLRCVQDEMKLRNCDGVYIWRLKGFGGSLAEMSADNLRMFYSSGFYTSPNGYKFCARINISSKDPQFLSVLLHMMQSDNDDALDWPFDGTMYFVLIHPHNPEKSIREKTTSIPDIEAFRKPVCELNRRSFGYTEFVQIDELKEFVQDDCLIFRIEVKPHDRPHAF